MVLKSHTRQTLLSFLLIGVFGVSAYLAFYVLVTPLGSKTTEGYLKQLPNSNKASASDSITVLSLKDKSPEYIKDIPQEKEVTLCSPFPRKASTYELFTKKITNTASQEGHTTYYDAVAKKLISVHPNERIELEYIPTVYNSKDKVKPTNITARVFRYKADSDLYAELGKVFDLDQSKDIESKLMKVSGLKDKEKYVYKSGSTVVEVVGQKTADIQRVAEQVGGSCDSKPVFDSGIPKGFVAWRTTNVDRQNRVEYVKIADADVTLNLEIAHFGSEIQVADNTESNNLGVSTWLPIEKFRLFSIPTKGPKGNTRFVESVHMFVVKNKDIQLLLNALQNRQKEIFKGTLVHTERTTYQAPRAVLGKNIYSYERSTEEGRENVREYVYVLSRSNTSFVFVYDFDDIEAVESLINNLK